MPVLPLLINVEHRHGEPQRDLMDPTDIDGAPASASAERMQTDGGGAEPAADEPRRSAIGPSDCTALLAEQSRTEHVRHVAAAPTRGACSRPARCESWCAPGTRRRCTGPWRTAWPPAAHAAGCGRRAGAGGGRLCGVREVPRAAAMWRLFRDEFWPRPFCYAVRRSPQHSPEGYLSI